MATFSSTMPPMPSSTEAIHVGRRSSLTRENKQPQGPSNSSSESKPPTLPTDIGGIRDEIYGISRHFISYSTPRLLPIAKPIAENINLVGYCKKTAFREVRVILVRTPDTQLFEAWTFYHRTGATIPIIKGRPASTPTSALLQLLNRTGELVNTYYRPAMETFEKEAPDGMLPLHLWGTL